MIGRQISHYKILAKLGEGGMGVVYKAEDTRLKRMVALKFLPATLLNDSEAKERFMREAQAASSLQHHNICNVHDIDETSNGQLYIVMDCYEGEVLKDKIAREPLTADETVAIAEQIAGGLAAAHEKGIVHRDIKPSNILLTQDGTVKILDFGLAKLATSATRVTRAGSTLGTVAYMSPEQLRGDEVDAGTDVWSLGVMMYEMITGHLPYKSQYEQAMIYSILNEEPESLDSTKPSVPPGLVQMINRAMQKNAGLRYASAAEMGQHLRKYRDSQKETPEGFFNLNAMMRTLRKPRVALSAGLALIVLCLSAVWFIDRQAKIRRAREILLPQIEQLVQVDRDNFIKAFNLANEAKKYIPQDKKLIDLFSAMQVEISITTEPQGAQVQMQEYKDEKGPWIHPGVTPIDRIKLPKGFFRLLSRQLITCISNTSVREV
ncbi:serine/threonine protein kinase [bacterium]|nr:serine/threonine protein kinase [bacterium]